MIDLYRKSILSQYGKDAGNQNMSDYIRTAFENYDKNVYLVQKQLGKNNINFSRKKKLKQVKNKSYSFYLHKYMKSKLILYGKFLNKARTKGNLFYTNK